MDSTFHSYQKRGFKNPTILAIAFEVKDIWSRRYMKSKIEEIKWLKKSKFEEVEDWRSKRIEELKDLKFGDSTRVCDSSRVSGATDMGMPLGYPRISIPGPAHCEGGQVQWLKDWLGDEERKLQYVFD
jgi:hypothetical protein